MGSPRVMPRQLAFMLAALGDECLLWTGSKDRCGYGRIKIAGELLSAHRLSYELFIEPMPDACEIHHICGNRACVHPGHLTAVGHNEHMRHHRLRYGDRCKWGHILQPENTREQANGTLICKPCQARRSREVAARRRREELA